MRINKVTVGSYCITSLQLRNRTVVLISHCWCIAMLQEAIAAAEGADGAAEEKNEMEELKQLLPDIREKVEDAKESQRTGSAASQAIQQTLVSTQHDQEQCTLF